MNRDQYLAAIDVCEKQIEAMTNECIRRNYGLKMRNYADTIHSCTQLVSYYEDKIKELDPVEPVEVRRGPGRPRKVEA